MEFLVKFIFSKALFHFLRREYFCVRGYMPPCLLMSPHGGHLLPTKQKPISHTFLVRGGAKRPSIFSSGRPCSEDQDLTPTSNPSFLSKDYLGPQ